MRKKTFIFLAICGIFSTETQAKESPLNNEKETTSVSTEMSFNKGCHVMAYNDEHYEGEVNKGMIKRPHRAPSAHPAFYLVFSSSFSEVYTEVYKEGELIYYTEENNVNAGTTIPIYIKNGLYTIVVHDSCNIILIEDVEF